MGEKEREKEKMLSAIIENAREAVVSVDADGKIIYANKATEDLFGWKADELVGKPMNILAVDANEQKKQFTEALRKGGARFETVRKARDGGIIPVLMTVVPFKDENGNLIFSSGIMVDIREQKKYESKIEHLNEVLHAIRNVNQLITKEKNEEKLLQKACEILVKVKGYTSVCISYNGKNYMAGEKKECKKALEFIKKRGTEKKEIASYEFNGRYLTALPITKNNTRAFLYIIQSKKINKEETGLLKEISGDIAFALDSIAKKKALKEKEILLSNVFESVQDGISILDTDLTIRHVNSAMEKWYEKSMPLVRKKCYEAYRNRKKPCDPCPSLRCMKSGRMERNIVPGLPGSSAEWIELFSHPIKDDSGNVIGIAEFVRDITERKKAEEELKENEAHFRGIFENATVGMYRTTPDGKILMVNPFLVKLLGYESEEELKRRDLNEEGYYEPDYKREKFIKEIEKKGYFVGEQAWKRKDGSTIFVRESAVAVRDEDGKTLYYDGVVEDITELKKTQDELIKSRDDWKAIFNSISDPVIVLAKNHTILDANPATLKALGKKKEEIIGKKCFEFFHEDHKVAEGCPMEKLLRSGRPEAESMEMDALGGIFLVTVSPVFEGKNIAKVIHHAKDITQLKQLIKALEESEEKYRSLFENSLNAIAIHEVVTDKKGKPIDYVFLEVNDAFERETGLKAKDVVGKRVTEVLPEVDRKFIEEYGKIALEGGSSRFEAFSASLGRYHEISVFSPRRGQFVTIFRDISERVKHIEDLKFLADSVAKLNEISSSGELHKFVAKSVKKLSGDSIVVVSSHNPSSLTLRVEMIEGIGKHASSLLKILGRDPVGMEFKINNKYSAMRKKLVRLEDGISDLTQGKIPKRVAPAIKKLLGTGDIYSIDIARGKELFGNITIVMKKGEKLENKTVVETFIRQASIAHQRILIRKQLEESEEKYRTLIENANDGICIIKDGLMKFVNPRLLEMGGYSEQDVINQPFSKFISEESLKEVVDKYKKRMTGEEVNSFYEAVIKRKDGGKIFAEFNVSVIDYEGDKAELVIVRDITERKKLMEALKESEERYRAIVENSHAGILVVGEDYKFSYVNDTLCNMLGYTREELIGHDFREFLDEGSRKLVADRYVRRQRGEDVPPRYEFNVVRKDGEKRCVEISSAVMKDSKGNMMTISQLLDITERKKAEEERLRLATGVYQAAEEIIITDTDGNIQYVNPAFEKITGYSRDEVIGKNPRILKSGKHDKKFYENLWNTILSGNTWNGEFVNKRKDGTLYIERASISPVKDDSGRIINFIAVKSDITEQKKTEEALKESEERFRSLVENAQDAIYIITPEGFEYVNPAFEELTGYSSEEIYSKDFDFRNLIHPDDVKKIEEREKAGEKGKELPSRYEFRIVTKDGKERIVEARTVGIGKGKGARIIGILRDMTERIKAEEKMKRILEQEKEFKLATAHYFFNPIAIAKGYLGLAMEKAYDEDQVENLKAAEHAIERVEKVVKNVTQKGEIYE